jgi:two-component system, chemotaxis family, sensor kinase CheA
MSEAVAELDEMQAIIEEFLIESDELIAKLDSDLVSLEKEPDNLDLLNEIFRSAHTIKGTSGFLGFNDLMSFTHAMEDVLNRLRKGEIKVEPAIMDYLLESVDVLKIILEDLKEGRATSVDYAPLKAKLMNFKQSETALSDKKVAKKSAAKSKKTTKKKTTSKKSKKSTKTEPEITAETEMEADIEEELESLLAEEEKTEQSLQSATAAAKKELFSKKKFDQTIRVDVNRLDSLMNMVGELVLGRNSLMQLSGQIGHKWEGEELVESVNQTSAQINFITTELQTAVMKMRMLPIGNVFNKFPRLVRDLSRDLKKIIDLEISGEETELDKTVIEEIGDPLIHLIRNSCDHGVEIPEKRREVGKSDKGTIWLNAGQEGSNIIIEVADDGGGIDHDVISKKAIEKGLATQEDIDLMAERDILQFIFAPGFSTAKQISDVSGRGVGMDVVRTNIEKLGGIIEIESEKHKGTKITVKLPLTLAIIQGLMVRSGNDIIIVPLASVLETVKIERKDIYYVNKHEVIKLRDNVLPIIDLNDLLGLTNPESEHRKPYVVVIGLAEKRLGLIVDELLGQEEVTIKTLGNYLGNTPGISGATILGDGRIRLIVDVLGMFGLAKKV